MLILLISFWLITLKLVESYTIVNVTDSNIEEFYEKYKLQTLFLIFYINNCPHSQNALEVLENFHSNDVTNLLIGEVDCTYSIFSCMRFNITKVPTIYLFKREYLYEFTYHISDISLNYFLSFNHTEENGIRFPEKKGVFDLVIKLWEEGIYIITNYIQEMINKYTTNKIKWEKDYTILGIMTITICMSITFIKVIIFSCLRRKKVI